MDLISVIVIIGVIAGIVGSIKDLLKRPIEGNKEYREPKREIYIEPYEEILPKKAVKKKKKKQNQKVDNLYTVEKNIDIKKVDVIPKSKQSRQKKSPFEVTKNPLTNAIIAAEVLGKPKCKR